MPPIPALKLAVSVEDYLEGEQLTDIKHEYLDGQVVAMGGASRKHGLIAAALAFALGAQARARRCQLFIADMKVRVEHEGETFFYYPDLILTCDPEDRHNLYCTRPCLIIEVLSKGTERIDRREKRLAYGLLPSLREYVLVDQDALCIDRYRRTPQGWVHDRMVEGALHLDCLELDIPLSEIYADIK
ncbi:MAG: hypothetical protein B7Z79_00575 [Thiomonas sp. 20-64-9]|jgi:Uma2 family endonuclease|uniref:Uma2 family endonuclease n=1 Tax=unclassified Thiomonas TaxID=2625466 RepID=UPI000BD9F88D|nr:MULTISPECIES: Uma2 family endonuclease [unclassified Thiomonas]OYV31952.1 MAG: hypothetical protein B7Z79_00575 [Thiomonas sp. 20-64-9]OZB71490.1 MAG: hypothetical protein B7X30_04490 [Thiomonas sp. 13-64-67]